ncbi:MAG: 4Fe-4S binding protein, partial [Tannerella sp.]|nr:4Fe-4S binding protein [Tannerella sp.]
MEYQNSRHALEIRPDICVGCSHCMRVCPTEALRVVRGKAVLLPDWCIDCGECFRVCPTRAIWIVDDDIKQIFKYKHRILLVPSVFFGQFENKISMETINGILNEMGFTEVAAVEQSVDLLKTEMVQYVETHPGTVISSFCPAVIRLIQVRFPMLVDHIMQLMPPLEVTARFYMQLYEDKGIKPEEIGIFYVTPCAAKIAAIKDPVGGYTSPIHGVINMDNLYNKVYLAYKNKKGGFDSSNLMPISSSLSSAGVRWPMTGGEARHVKGRALAIDGMDNVIEFLEKLENEEVKDVDFLELRVCDESCAGGILACGNRFLTVEYLKQMADAMPQNHEYNEEYQRLCSAYIPMQPIEPRSMVKYDTDMKIALEKMEQVRALRKLL